MQSQLLLMPRQNGLRYRGTQRQPQPQPRSSWVNNTAVRAELFGNRAAESAAAATNLAIQRSFALQEAQLRAMAEEQAAAAEQSSYAADVLIAGQGSIQAATIDLKQATREIKSITTETLTVTKRVEKGVNQLKTMLRSPGGAASMMMNPFFALVVFFIAHPYLPVTIETVMPVWSLLLSMNYVKQIGMKISNGEALISLEGGLLGIAKNLVFNAPHAIVLMWKLSQMWTEERNGTRGYTTEHAAAFAATMEPSNWEPFIAAQFSSTMEGIRSVSLESLQNMTMPGVPRVNMTEMRDYLNSVSDQVYTDLQQLDPILFKDKAGIVQLLLEYAMGKLVVKAKNVGVATLNMPAYLYQARTVMSAEAWVFQTLLIMVKDIYAKIFKDIGDSIKVYVCTALCTYAPDPKVEEMLGGGVGGGFSDWVSGKYTSAVETITSGASAVTNAIGSGASSVATYTKQAVIDAGGEVLGSLVGKIAVWSCDCSKYGKVPPKPKMDGGAKSRKSSKSSRRSHSPSKTRKSIHKKLVPKDHAEFLRLSWRLVMYLIAPTITGLPVFPTQSEFLALDAEWRDLLLAKVNKGQFVPPILLTGVEWKDYMLE